MPKTKRIRLKVPPSVLAVEGGLASLLQARAELALDSAMQKIHGELVRKAPFSDGLLSNSIRVVKDRGESGNVRRGIVMNFYGQLQDDGYGGKGVFPPDANIRRWVKNKGLHRRLNTAPWMAKLLPKAGSAQVTRRRKQNRFTLEEKLDLATRFVRKKIAEKGVQTHQGWIDEALNVAEPEAQRIIDSFLSEGLS